MLLLHQSIAAVYFATHLLPDTNCTYVFEMASRRELPKKNQLGYYSGRRFIAIISYVKNSYCAAFVLGAFCH
jgi:hypothetical protein